MTDPIYAVAPATVWAWNQVRASQASPNANAELVLLAVAYLDDRNLNGPSGRRPIDFDEVARLVPFARSTVARILRGLAVDGRLARMTGTKSSPYRYEPRTGPRMPYEGPLGGYQVPEEAFRG